MHTFVLIALVASMLAAVASPVEAQGSGFRGLFGGAQGSAGRTHMLDLNVSLFGSYITDVTDETDETGGAEGTTPSGSSPMMGTSGTLTYQRNWRSATISGYGTGGVSHVFEQQDVNGDSLIERWQVGVAGSFQRDLSRRTQWATTGHAAYSPNYSFGLGSRLGGLGAGQNPGTGLGLMGGGGTADAGIVEGVPVVPGLDYALLSEPVIVSGVASTLERRLSTKGSFQAYYAGHMVSFLDSAGDSDQLSHVVGARYRHVINRYVSARAGYGYRRSDYGDNPVASHDIDVGVDGGYGREFALGRRTAFSFTTRSSVHVYDQPGPDQTFTPSTRVYVGGSASLNHQMGRTWTGELRYDRAAGFTAGFPDPFFSNVATGSIRGLLTRRMDVVAFGRYTAGDVGFSGDDRGFWSATAQVSVRTALGRHLAAHAQYFLYRYNFEQGVTLPGQLRPSLDRQGVSVGITAWVPFI